MNPSQLAEIEAIEALFVDYETLLNLKAVVPLSERVFDPPVDVYRLDGACATLSDRQAIVEALNSSLEEPRADGLQIVSEISKVQFVNAHIAVASVVYRAPVGCTGEVEVRPWFYMLQKKVGGAWRIRMLVAQRAASVALDP